MGRLSRHPDLIVEINEAVRDERPAQTHCQDCGHITPGQLPFLEMSRIDLDEWDLKRTWYQQYAEPVMSRPGHFYAVNTDTDEGGNDVQILEFLPRVPVQHPAMGVDPVYVAKLEDLLAHYKTMVNQVRWAVDASPPVPMVPHPED